MDKRTSYNHNMCKENCVKTFNIVLYQYNLVMLDLSSVHHVVLYYCNQKLFLHIFIFKV